MENSSSRPVVVMDRPEVKVYIAFIGEYSSRGVIGIFSNEAKARECSEDIEEYGLDEYADHITQKVYTVQLYTSDGALRGGSVNDEFCKPNLRESSTHECAFFPRLWSWQNTPEKIAAHAVEQAHVEKGTFGMDIVRYSVGRSTQSQEEALKLAAEARQAHLREQKP